MDEACLRPSRYPHVTRAIAETPWAILPETLAAIVELVSFRAAGGELTSEEIQARIGAGPAQRQVAMAGTIAVLPLYGVLFPRASLFSEISGGTALQRFAADFDRALSDESVSAILIDVHSPGGSTYLATETAGKIRTARGRKPIVAVANTLCASCAYHIASQADELVASPSSLLGSIGVFTVHDDLTAMQEMLGIRSTLVSAGKFKTEGHPLEPLTEEALEALQALVDRTYDLMAADIAKGRGVRVSEVRNGFGQGRVVGAALAVELGMADRVETYEATLARLARGSFEPRRSSPRGALHEAGELSAKAMPPHSTDVVDEPWDGPAEEAKIPNEAGERTIRRMYAWVDPDGDPDTKGAYALPHHKVVEEESRAANVNGVRAALQRLPQSRIPESDHEDVRRHLQGHLDDFERSEQEELAPALASLRALAADTRAETEARPVREALRSLTKDMRTQTQEAAT